MAPLSLSRAAKRRCSAAFLAGLVHFENGSGVAAAQDPLESPMDLSPAVDRMSTSIYLNLTSPGRIEESDGEMDGQRGSGALSSWLRAALEPTLPSGWQTRDIMMKAAWSAAVLAGGKVVVPAVLPLPAALKRRALKRKALQDSSSGAEAEEDAVVPGGAEEAEANWTGPPLVLDRPEAPEVEARAWRRKEDWESWSPCSVSNVLPWLTVGTGLWSLARRRIPLRITRRRPPVLVTGDLESGCHLVALKNDSARPRSNESPLKVKDEVQVELVDTPRGKLRKAKDRDRVKADAENGLFSPKHSVREARGFVRRRTREIENKIEFFRVATEDVDQSSRTPGTRSLSRQSSVCSDEIDPIVAEFETLGAINHGQCSFYRMDTEISLGRQVTGR